MQKKTEQVMRLNVHSTAGVKEHNQIARSALIMKSFKVALFGTVAAISVSAMAHAAEPGTPTAPTASYAYPPQVATNPGLPYSSARTSGPKVGPSNWIPSNPATTPNSESDSGSYYSKKGFGPAPN
jgi:hypothetical protein